MLRRLKPASLALLLLLGASVPTTSCATLARALLPSLIDTGTGECCIVCTGGQKPCGDTCIPRNAVCTQPTGCACSGLEE